MVNRLLAAGCALACGVGLAHLSRGVPTLGMSQAWRGEAQAAIVSDPRLAALKRSLPPEPRAAHIEPISLATALGKRFARGKIITGATPHRLILFTFDDGPGKTSTPRLLDALDDAGIKATFFLSAWRIRGDTPAQRDQAAIAIDIVRRGHIVANHGLDHEQLPLLNNSDATYQILGAQEIIENTLGERPWLFRPPGGARSERVDAILAAHGYTTVMWNLGAGDVQVETAQEVFDTWKRVFDRREREEGHSGGIILLHDTHEWSVDGFRMIYAELMRRNCKYLARNEELYDIVDDPSFFYVPRGSAVASHEAPPAAPPLELLEARQRRLRQSTAHRCKTSSG